MADHNPKGSRLLHKFSGGVRLHRWIPFIVLSVITTAFASVNPTFADTSAVPQLAQWEANMISYGRQHCNGLAPGAAPDNYQAEYTYYDAIAAYYQIMLYTGDPTWRYCAGLALNVYRDKLVLPQNGRIQGYWAFTKGLLVDWQRTHDPLDYTAIEAIVHNAAFASDGTPLEWTASIDSSREVAYAIVNYLNAEAVGEPRRARLADMVNQSLGHIDQWFIARTAPYMRPFMVALTCKALIQYYEATLDPRIPPAVKRAIDGVWSQTWLPDQLTFQYTNIVTSTGGLDPSPDLNLLIAPVYAWWYLQSGETTYRDKADLIFEGGVRYGSPSLYYAKQFNQSYFWSFYYLRYRMLAQPGMATASTPAPTPSSPQPPVTQALTTTPTVTAPTTITAIPTAPTTKTATISIDQSAISSTQSSKRESNGFLGKLKRLMDRVK